MDSKKLMAAVKSHPDFDHAGMVLLHNGVVRSTSRDGRKVTGLKIKVDYRKLENIVNTQKALPGIVDIRVEIDDTRDLKVGDDVMYLIVAGDIRENVIHVLKETLDLIKTTVTTKTEYFVG
ncbi:MAG: molybdenum cofactor biosynthesis protein MoaE [Proteobacteria bacterium]|nr:molybdenum cofactor biosynthesis protein MoaE [Pseudomonadota bacterium]